MTSLEHPSESQLEEKEYHENAEGVGAMAFRASWLYEKMKNLKQGSAGLPVVADAPIAEMLRKNYPEVEVYDSGSSLYQLGPKYGVKKLEVMDKEEKQMLPFDWVIAAESTGVYLKNIRDGRFVVMQDTDFLDTSWEGGMPDHSNELHAKKEADQAAHEDYVRRKMKGERIDYAFDDINRDPDSHNHVPFEQHISLAEFESEINQKRFGT